MPGKDWEADNIDGMARHPSSSSIVVIALMRTENTCCICKLAKAKTDDANKPVLNDDPVVDFKLCLRVNLFDVCNQYVASSQFPRVEEARSPWPY